MEMGVMKNFNNVPHSTMVTALVKPGGAIVESLTPSMANLLHMGVGVSGESGELLDAIKKHVIYNKPLDVENVIEELGDMEFYMEGLRQEIGVTREDTLSANKLKLSKRYHSLTYTDEHARERMDKTK
jgi:NTP pyrophosphatase (non-canonical NTP hydrolase)